MTSPQDNAVVFVFTRLMDEAISNGYSGFIGGSGTRHA